MILLSRFWENSMDRYKRKAMHVINNNQFDSDMYILSGLEKQQLNELLKLKNSILRERTRVLNILNPLVIEEQQLAKQLRDINYQMCALEGHQFSASLAFDTKAYGRVYKCQKCGMIVASNKITIRDTFIDTCGQKRVRILYKK